MPAQPSLPALLMLGLMAAWPAARADSLVTSSAVGGSSASSAASSASDSSKTSSDSSSKKTQTVEGPYRIIDVAALPDRPGLLRLRLQAQRDAGEGEPLTLVLPAETFDRHRLAAGQTVTARARPYGTEFALGVGRQAFFLVLSDDWARELPSNPVLL